MSQTISCPHCGKSVAVEDALRHQIEDSVKTSLAETHKKELEKAENKIRSRLEKELFEKSSKELDALKSELEEKDKKVERFRKEEMKLRVDKRNLEDAQKELELTVVRKLDEERKNIEENTAKKIAEEFHFKEKEKEKVINDLKKALEDAQRKAQQGSQQLQGEVLELDFEESLIKQFPDDEIVPVEKGVKGADVRQIVKSPKGVVCGVILWENKRTKAWKDDWLSKLKNDLRAEKANVPVVVTTTLPREIKNGMGIKDGVWVTNPTLALILATLLRKSLIDVGYQKAVTKHRGDKADQLYSYITSHEFLQEIEAVVELHQEIRTQVAKERAAFERQWKIRDKQAEKLLATTARMVGGIQGEVGQSALPVKGLDLLDDGDNDLLSE